MVNWLPMAKAPKDGTMILVTETPNGENYNVIPACWMAHGKENINPNDELEDWCGVCPAHWSPSEGPLHVRWRCLVMQPICWKPFYEPEPIGKLRRRAGQIYAAISKKKAKSHD